MVFQWFWKGILYGFLWFFGVLGLGWFNGWYNLNMFEHKLSWRPLPNISGSSATTASGGVKKMGPAGWVRVI